MGQYRIEIVAVGNHGCQREIPSGGTVAGCGQPNCPDCLARDFVKRLSAANNSVENAVLIHWPSGPGTVLDNLLTGERSGQFFKAPAPAAP